MPLVCVTTMMNAVKELEQQLAALQTMGGPTIGEKSPIELANEGVDE